MNTTRRLAIEQAIVARFVLRGPMTKSALLAHLGCKGPQKSVDNALRRLQREKVIRFHDRAWSIATKTCPQCKGVGVVDA